MQELKRFHPVVSFLFFMIALCVTMFWMHPILLCCSFLLAFIYLWRIEGKQILGWMLKLFPLAIISILINVLFHHRGSTILAYFPNGNPLTLESILFGISAAMMILSSIMWFRLFHFVVTSDHLLYLFGKTVPKVSLILSMIFRFVPRMMKEFREILAGQKALSSGLDHPSENKLKRIGQAFLTEISLAFENSIEIAMSMKMRGFHEQKRSFFSRYEWTKKDFAYLGIMLLLFFIFLRGITSKMIYYRFYPTMQMNSCGFAECLYLVSYLCFLCMPLMIEIRENVRWQRLRSKI